METALSLFVKIHDIKEGMKMSLEDFPYALVYTAADIYFLYKSIHGLTHITYVTWSDILALPLVQCFQVAFVQCVWLTGNELRLLASTTVLN